MSDTPYTTGKLAVYECDKDLRDGEKQVFVAIPDDEEWPLDAGNILYVAECIPEDVGIVAARANARLYAAAPDLLEACIQTLPVLEAVQKLFEKEGAKRGLIPGGPLDAKIRSAIAKATRQE